MTDSTLLDDDDSASQRQQRLDLALDAGRLGVWEWDIETDNVHWSKQLYELFGYTREQFVPTRDGFLTIIHPEDREFVSGRLDDCFSGRCESYEMEFRVLRGDDGRTVWTSGRGIIQRDERGRPVKIIAAATDRTERKQFELALADREQQLRRVIDHTLNFIGVLDCDGVLLEANATALQAGGVEREAVIGLKFWDCYWWNFDEDVIQRLQDAIACAAAGETVRYDETVRMAGETRIVIDFMISPVRDESGQITHLVASGVDINDRKQAERDLAEAKQRLDLAMETSRVAAWSWNASSNQPVSNPNLNRLFGFDEDAEPALDEFLARIHSDDRPRIEQAVRNTIDNGAAYDEEYRVNLPSGEMRWVYARGTASFDGSGTFQEFSGVISDVTEHKLYELELANREAHLRRVIDNQIGLVGVIGRDGTLLEVDDDSMRIAGVTREDVIGKHFAECAWWTYDDSVSQMMRDTMDRAFAGETVRFDVPLFAGGLETPSKRLVIDFMLAPVRDDEGVVTHLIPSGVDISDRVAAEEAQRENQERLRMALRAGGMAAWEWNSEASVWTDEVFELLGIPPRENPSPELFFEYVHPDDVDGLRVAWQRAVTGREDYSHEFRVIRPDGEVRWIVGVGEVVRDSEDNVVRLFGLNWDSTQEHLAAQALKESEIKAQLASKAKSEFVANMSHEIRTPMTAVLGYADMLLQQENDPEKLEYLSSIQKHGNMLLGIINDILDLSKIEAGKLSVETEWFSLVEVVNEIRSMMQVRATEQGLRFEVDFDGELPARIQSDPKRLRQILINLVGNAIKFTAEGEVRLSVRESLENGRTMIRFVVADTGIGISAEKQDVLFLPFSQGDAAVSRSYGGTGLGLAISRRLADMLGGDISVDSELGKGSRFSFSIDPGDLRDQKRIRPATEIVEPTPAPEPPTEQPTLDCVVYIVDDRRDVRFLSGRFLGDVGATIEEAADGLEAVERITADADFRSSVDIILLDMQMPRLDGYQTASRLRSLGFDKPIIALTADAMRDDENRCIAAGCTAFLSKPIDREELLSLVAQFTT